MPGLPRAAAADLPRREAAPAALVRVATPAGRKGLRLLSLCPPRSRSESARAASTVTIRRPERTKRVTAACPARRASFSAHSALLTRPARSPASISRLNCPLQNVTTMTIRHDPPPGSAAARPESTPRAGPPPPGFVGGSDRRLGLAIGVIDPAQAPARHGEAGGRGGGRGPESARVELAGDEVADCGERPVLLEGHRNPAGRGPHQPLGKKTAPPPAARPARPRARRGSAGSGRRRPPRPPRLGRRTAAHCAPGQCRPGR